MASYTLKTLLKTEKQTYLKGPAHWILTKWTHLCSPHPAWEIPYYQEPGSSLRLHFVLSLLSPKGWPLSLTSYLGSLAGYLLNEPFDCSGQESMCSPRSLFWQQLPFQRRGGKKCVWGSNFVCRRKVLLISNPENVRGRRKMWRRDVSQ